MAIALDATSNSGAQGTVSTFNWNHIVSSGLSNSILVVGIQIRDTGTANRVVSNLTYNGVKLTKSIIDDDMIDFIHTELWYLLNPTNGTNSIVVTLGGSSFLATAGAISLSGVNQGAPVDTTAGHHQIGAGSNSLTLTTLQNNDWIVDSFYQKSGNVSTLGTNQTKIFELYPGATPANTSNGSGDTTDMSYQIAGNAGAYTNIYTWAPVDDTSMVAIALIAASSGLVTAEKPNLGKIQDIKPLQGITSTGGTAKVFTNTTTTYNQAVQYSSSSQVYGGVGNQNSDFRPTNLPIELII